MSSLNQCISADAAHLDADPSNRFDHYWGCLPFRDREAFLDEEKNKDISIRVQREVERIERLRRLILNDAKDAPPETKDDLVAHVRESLEGWRDQFKDREGDLKSKAPKSEGEEKNDAGSETLEYNPSADVKSYLIQFNRQHKVCDGTGSKICTYAGYPPKPNAEETATGGKGKKPERSETVPERSEEAPERTPDASENTTTSTERKKLTWEGLFPDQKLTTDALLESDGHLLDEKDSRPESSQPSAFLRHFHFPSNNMSWVEKAMARYFNVSEKLRIDPGDRPRNAAEMILRHEYWRGQQHGGTSSFIHARHLRPICEALSSDAKAVEPSPRNIVLYMPILHWETDKKRHNFAKIIDDANARYHETRNTNVAEEFDTRRRENAKLWNKQFRIEGRTTSINASNSSQLDLETFGGAVLAYVGQYSMRLCRRGLKREGHRLKFPNRLAQFLYDASRLLEAMENYRDRKMIDKYLFTDCTKPIRPGWVPNHPLHPRRTLDQAYYCSLKTTKSRDRDQVVYRETTARDDLWHSWHHVKWVEKDHGSTNPWDTSAPTGDVPRDASSVETVADDKSSHSDGVQAQEVEHAAAGLSNGNPQATTTSACSGSSIPRLSGNGDASGSLTSKPLPSGQGQDIDHGIAANGTQSEGTEKHSKRERRDVPRRNPKFNPERAVKWDCKSSYKARQKKATDLDNLGLYARKFNKMNRRCPKCASSTCTRKSDKCELGMDHGSLTGSEGENEIEETKADSECKWCSSRSWLCTCKYKWIGKKEPPLPPSKKATDLPCQVCTNHIRQTPRVVMVDQLWMWVLDERTILTFFPRRYGFNRQDITGIHKKIRKSFDQAREGQIKSVYDMALIILAECATTFFDRKRTPDLQPRVLDLFAEAIGRVAHKQTIAYQHIWASAETIRRTCAGPSSVDLSRLHIPLLNITPEGKLQREIKDVMDELGIMEYLITQQVCVIERFVANVKPMLGPNDQEKKESEQYKWFMRCGNDLIADVKSHLHEVESLKGSAESTADGLEKLLGLKQQQAGLIQAWQAIKQGEEAVKQGRAIMIFTIMTIIFLPLAFIAAVFGMNNSKFNPEAQTKAGKKPIELNLQILIMFVVSAGTILIAIIFAFSPFFRAVTWCQFENFSTRFLVRLGVYRSWTRRSPLWGSSNQLRRYEILTRNAKDIEKVAAQRRFILEVEETLRLKVARSDAHKNRNRDENIPTTQSSTGTSMTQGNGDGINQHQRKPRRWMDKLRRRGTTKTDESATPEHHLDV